MKRLFLKLTGGRPMHLIGYSFTDVVVNKPVYDYIDYKGRLWLAHNRWGWFRVRTDR